MAKKLKPEEKPPLRYVWVVEDFIGAMSPRVVRYVIARPRRGGGYVVAHRSGERIIMPVRSRWLILDIEDVRKFLTNWWRNRVESLRRQVAEAETQLLHLEQKRYTENVVHIPDARRGAAKPEEPVI